MLRKVSNLLFVIAYSFNKTNNNAKLPDLYFKHSLPYMSDIDECTKLLHSCNLNAVCNNTNGSYECTCRNGYTGDGHSCAGKDHVSVINQI